MFSMALLLIHHFKMKNYIATGINLLALIYSEFEFIWKVVNAAIDLTVK